MRQKRLRFHLHTGNERGSALVLAVFVLVLLAGMGSALLFLSENETKMSRADLRSKQAFFIAEAGLEDARMGLYNAIGGDSFDDELAARTGGNGEIDFDPNALNPAFDGQGNMTGFSGGVGDDTPLLQLTPLAASNSEVSGQYTVFLTNDHAEPALAGGYRSKSDTNERVMLTSVGIGPNGSMEIAQAVVEQRRKLPSIPPAAMTMLGPPPLYDNGSSSSQAHDGTDCPQGGGIPGLYVPIVGVTNGPSQAQVRAQMSRADSFTSGSLGGEATIGNLLNPRDPAMAQSSLTPIDPAWTDCLSLKALVEDLISSADLYCNTDSGSCSVPAGSRGRVIVIDGDADAGGFDAGLLVVTGEVTYGGGTTWDGIVLVIGEGRLRRTGGGNGQNQGSVILANVDPSPNGARADKTDWCTAGTDGFSQTSFDVEGAGNSSISYCSARVKANNPPEPYRVVEFLQR